VAKWNSADSGKRGKERRGYPKERRRGSKETSPKVDERERIARTWREERIHGYLAKTKEVTLVQRVVSTEDRSWNIGTKKAGFDGKNKLSQEK